jgi:hypothetical protein
MKSDGIRENAISFEAVKTSMTQNKDGVILRLAIHPNDLPKELLTDFVGSRYLVAMVRMDDDNQPVERNAAINKVVAAAGMLCRNINFQTYLASMGWDATDPDEGKAEAKTARCLKSICGVGSRADLAHDDIAMQKFTQLRDGFRKWMETRG